MNVDLFKNETHSTILSSEKLDTTPDGPSLQDDIAGNFMRLSEVLEEMLDNVFSNLIRHASEETLRRSVEIEVIHCGDYVDIGVRDGGTGIENLGAALSIVRTGGDTVLNEHGIGLNHALASINSTPSQMWTIQTRTARDVELGQYREVSSPYEIPAMSCLTKQGCGGVGEGTGTYIRFRCPLVMFNTLKPKGKRTEPTFAQMIDYLAEDLRCTYGPILESEEFSIEISGHGDGEPVNRTLDSALRPLWNGESIVKLPSVTTDLGGGKPVTIECTYGQVRPSKKNSRFYRCTIDSSGVEVRLNGRLIEYNLFQEIWGEKAHNSQNHFLCQVNLKYDHIDAVPATRSSKNGFRVNDPRLDELFRWVKNNVEKPKKVENGAEHALVMALQQKLQKEPDVLRATMEEGAYESLGLRTAIDLFVSRSDNTVTIYEAKVGNTKAEHLYQLLLYWDGCVRDRKPATTAILIAQRHPAQVRQLAEELNRRNDVRGQHYNIKLVTWAEAGVTG